MIDQREVTITQDYYDEQNQIWRKQVSKGYIIDFKECPGGILATVRRESGAVEDLPLAMVEYASRERAKTAKGSEFY